MDPDPLWFVKNRFSPLIFLGFRGEDDEYEDEDENEDD